MDYTTIYNKIISRFATIDNFLDIIEGDDLPNGYYYIYDSDQYYLVNDVGSILTWYKHIGRCTYFAGAVENIDTFLDRIYKEVA